MRKNTIEAREAILRLIDEQTVTHQQDILDTLTAQKIELTQATLSRLLKKLNIRKEGGIYIKATQPLDYASSFGQKLQAHSCPPNLIIIKTAPGHANALAATVDHYIQSGHPDFKSIAGSVAGDDTIFLATTGATATHPILNALQKGPAT